MHEWFTNHYYIFGSLATRTYLSSTDGSLTAAIAKNSLDVLRTITEEYNKAYFVTFWNLKGFNLSRWFYHRCHRQSALPQYIQHLAHICDLNHILKTIVFSDFKINILITGSLFTTSTIKWQWHLYFIAYSNCSAVKPFKPVQFLLMIFFCFMPAVIMSETSHHHYVSNSATSRNKDTLHILSHQICKYSRTGKILTHLHTSGL